MAIVPGKAVLELYPVWPAHAAPAVLRSAALVRAVKALTTAHPLLISIRLCFDEPALTVEVAIPADGSLDLAELQRQLTSVATSAITSTSPPSG